MPDADADADHGGDDHERSPVDQLVDLFVYAPLGLAMTVRDSLPDLVDKGRQQFASQAAVAKMIGEFGVKQVGKDVRRRLDEVTELLSDLGVFPGARTAPTGPASPSSSPSSTSTSPSSTSSSSGNGRAARPPVDDEPAAPAGPRPDSSGLAIPGYDTLSASQVVQRLAGLSADELEAVRAYEEATRGRRTILSKISQLQSS
jgi:hypothetical protein